MKTQLIFLLGESNVGKDTVGSIFIKHGYTRVSFADLVKEEYATLNSIPLEHLHEFGEMKEKHRPGIIQHAEAKRAIDPYYWLDKAFEPYLTSDKNFKPNLKLVITDCRRFSEIDWIYLKKNLALIDPNFDIKLFHIRNPRTIDTDTLTHFAIGYAYGCNVDPDITMIDGIIMNDSTKEDLVEKVEKCIEVNSL